jgi:hypothetical protein
VRYTKIFLREARSTQKFWSPVLYGKIASAACIYEVPVVFFGPRVDFPDFLDERLLSEKNRNGLIKAVVDDF